MQTPAISVIIAWADRDELASCLRQNAGMLNREGVEVLVVNAGGSAARLRSCVSGARYQSLRIIDVPVQKFNKSLALNLGAHFSRGGKLFVLDADIVMRSDFISEASPMLEEGAFVTIRRRYESATPYPSPVWGTLAKNSGCIESVRRTQNIELQFSDGSITTLRISVNDLLTGSDAGHGHVLLKKADFLAVGGYHSDVNTWGWEDDDLLFRLQKILGLRHCEAGEALHLSHNDDRRMLQGASKFSSNAANMLQCLLRYAKRNFGGTYFEDSTEWASKSSNSDVDFG
jgi:predicted glycosyltransferase involved in capsule biosynthesis